MLHISWQTIFLWSLYLKWPQKPAYFQLGFFFMCQGPVFSTDLLIKGDSSILPFKGLCEIKGNICFFVAVNHSVRSSSLILILKVISFVSVFIVNGIIPEGFILCDSFSFFCICRIKIVYIRQTIEQKGFSFKHFSPFFTLSVPLHFCFYILMGDVFFVCITSPTGADLVAFGFKAMGEGKNNTQVVFYIPSKNTGFKKTNKKQKKVIHS